MVNLLNNQIGLNTRMMPSPTASDSELVTRALRGEGDAFADLYNRYFSSVYDFLHRTMRNTEEAADITQTTFLRAMENLDALTNPGAFKSWLLSIAHHQALNRLERERRFLDTPIWPGGERPEIDPILCQVDTDRLANPEDAAETKETACFVWEAAASLDKRTYAVLDLHVRQGLDSAEIAEVLGVSSGNAYTLLHRMKRSLEEAIGSYLLMRRGSTRCETLRRMVEVFAIPPVTLDMRKGVERHVRKCDVCTETKRTLLAPLAVFGAFAAVPAPAGLQEHIWGNLAEMWSQIGPASFDQAGHAGRKARRPRGTVRKTFSRPWPMPWTGRNYSVALALLMVAGLTTLLFVMMSFSLPGGGSVAPVDLATATRRPTITRAPTKTTTPTIAATSTAEVTATATPEPTEEPTMPPTPTPKAPPGKRTPTPEPPTDTPLPAGATPTFWMPGH